MVTVDQDGTSDTECVCCRVLHLLHQLVLQFLHTWERVREGGGGAGRNGGRKGGRKGGMEEEGAREDKSVTVILVLW